MTKVPGVCLARPCDTSLVPAPGGTPTPTAQPIEWVPRPDAGGHAVPFPIPTGSHPYGDRALNPVNHYDVLGVPADATLAHIRTAYRSAAQLCHPDRNAGNLRAEARFKALGTAYRVLRQPALRRAFDRDIGLGGDWKPWYGTPEDGDLGSGRSLPLEALEQIAVQLAVANRWPAPRIAAHLATLGCSYRNAWEIAWRSRYQVLNESLEQMVRREAAVRARARPPMPDDLAGVGRRVATPMPPSARTDGRPHVSARVEPPAAGAGGSRSPVEFRPSVWSTRIRRLRRILSGLSRQLGFEPPRLAREHRKRLRLEYDSRPTQESSP